MLHEHKSIYHSTFLSCEQTNKQKNINLINLHFSKKTFQILNMRRLQLQNTKIKTILLKSKCGFLIQITVLHVTRAAFSYYDVTNA